MSAKLKRACGMILSLTMIVGKCHSLYDIQKQAGVVV